MNLKDKLTHPIFGIISTIADKHNEEVYVIGGYVRDLILNRSLTDIDIMVVGNGIAFAEKVAEFINNDKQISIFKNFGTAMLKYQDTDIEFVGARKESYHSNSRKPSVENGTLEDDQKRRDFTINTLAVSLNAKTYGELTDPFNGLNDIEQQIIKTPLEPNVTFSDDPLRMLRAVRFASQLHFDIAAETFDAIFNQIPRLKILSKERIADELNKIILSPKPSYGFRLLDASGLLQEILPEITSLKGIEKNNGWAHKDNFIHTLEVLDHLSEKSNNLWLRWAALLHDIGKPITKRFDPKIGWTFHGHEFVGAKMVNTIIKRLKLPQNEKLKYVEKLVALHLRPIVLAEDIVTDSAVRRLLFEAGNDIDDLMLLCRADITSKNREKVLKYQNNFTLVEKKLIELEEKDRIRNFQPPISGEDIMNYFKINPCKEVGIIKDAIKDAIIDGIIPNERDVAWEMMIKEGQKLQL